MNKSLLQVLALILPFAGLLFFSSFTETKNSNSRDNTPGNVSFTVKTKAAGGNYSPRHVLAIWIEKDGNFVKTRKAMANNRKQYLYTWKNSSNYNVVDAITGSTLNSHQTHTITWDCTDLDGNVVPDGTYTMLIEFTEKHAQGPLFSIDFSKGDESITITPEDQSYFTDMNLVYEPEIVLIADFTADNTQACPNEEIEFTDNSTGATSWEWNFGEDANPASATTQGPHSVSYSTSGSKNVSLTINGSVTQNKPNFITVAPQASAAYSWTQQSRTISFTNNSTHAVSYLWNFGDDNTSNDENPEHTYAQDGTYTVNLTAVSEMCDDDIYTEEIVIYTVGLGHEQEKPATEVYPNPSNGEFNFVSAQKLNNAQISIFNIHGGLVYVTNLKSIEANTPVSIGNNSLAPGMYYLNLECDAVHFVEKLLIK